MNPTSENTKIKKEEKHSFLRLIKIKRNKLILISFVSIKSINQARTCIVIVFLETILYTEQRLRHSEAVLVGLGVLVGLLVFLLRRFLFLLLRQRLQRAKGRYDVFPLRIVPAGCKGAQNVIRRPNLWVQSSKQQ